MKAIYLATCVWLAGCFACVPVQPETNRPAQVLNKASAWAATYANRTDWQAFLACYRQDLHFEDELLNKVTHSLDSFAAFYNWPDTSFQKMHTGQQMLVITEWAVNDSLAVGRGYFDTFKWQGQVMQGPWPVTFWLWFDHDLQISRQVDVIDYPRWLLCAQ